VKTIKRKAEAGEIQTSTMVILAALHMGWLKFLAVFLTEENKKEGI